MVLTGLPLINLAKPIMLVTKYVSHITLLSEIGNVEQMTDCC
jgi:hypothetical protein